MLVRDFADYLQALSGPVRATGGIKSAKELDELVARLRPLENWSLEQLLQLLTQAEEYRQTGILPVAVGKAPKKSTAKSGAQEKLNLQDALTLLKQLYEQTTQPEFDPTRLDAELQKVEKALSKGELLRLAGEFQLSTKFKTKGDAIKGIRNRVLDRKDAYDRTQF